MKNKPRQVPTRVVLASTSPRREEMLRVLNIDFETFVPKVLEEWHPHQKARQVACDLAVRKAGGCKDRKALVIGMDTIVVLNRQMLGKPESTEDARAMLQMLSHRIHRVITGVALQWQGKLVSDAATTKVEFREIQPREMDWYIGTGEPFDKAGGYAIQGAGRIFINRIDGCYYNVVGFPLTLFQRLLRRFGLSVLDLQRA